MAANEFKMIKFLKETKDNGDSENVYIIREILLVNVIKYTYYQIGSI